MIGWRAAVIGACVSLVIALPVALVVRARLEDEAAWQESNGWLLAVPLLLGAFVIGGLVAGRRQRATPLSTSAASGFLAFGVLVVIIVVRNAVRGTVPPILTLVVYWMVLVSCSMVGGLLASKVESYRARSGSLR